MKYIVMEDESGNRELFIFPNAIHHDAMAEELSAIKNQTFDNWERVRRIPISAGFISPENECYGESGMLKLESWGEDDTKLLKQQLEEQP